MLRRAVSNFFLLWYFIVVFLFLAASFTTYINPATLWHVGFLGLVFPYLLVALLVFIVMSLFIRPKYALVGIIALLFAHNNILSLAAFRIEQPFNNSKDREHIRVMTWNVRRFAPYNVTYFDPRNNNLDAIVEEVERFEPDIVCLQEFYTAEDRKSRNVELFQSIGYRYYAFAIYKNPYLKSSSGTIIFSRYPIARSYIYDMPKKISTAAEDPVSADIIINGDTVRVATFHMQSYGFLNRDYEDMARIKNKADTGLRGSKNIFRKMRYAFTLRGLQADIINEKINASPYPVVLCGDLNDVPSSYAYITTRGKHKDAFLEKGSGLGKTYISGRSRFLTWLPTLRIDYIFVDQRINVMQFKQVPKQLSDHRGLIADLALPKK